MKLELRMLMLALILSPSLLFADAFLMPGTVTKDELVKPFPQPYVVKKGDTLWDIAEEYFADPYKWIKIWEQNLYVSNPDLIYPGNEIWLRMKPVADKPKPKRQTVKLEPRIIYKPAQRIEKEVDPKIFLSALVRQDFIRPDAIEGVGHILDSEDERLNYGAFDKVYLNLDLKAKPGDVFDIFRTGDPVYRPTESGREMMGYLVKHLGRVEVTSEESGVYRGTIIEAFEEIGRTDRLKVSKPKDYNIEPVYPKGPLLGRVIYIRDDAAEAGQGQVLGIDLGKHNGLEPGSVLGLYRQGRLVRDLAYQEETYQALPEEKIGEVIVLVPQENASIVLVMSSSAPINTGDLVQAVSR